MTYNTEWLLNLISSGVVPKYVFFWGHKSNVEGKVTKACFSQWWPCTFVVDGNTYVSSEHWMMAEKARVFGDIEIYNKILTVIKPGAAKALGRQVRNFNQERWNTVKFDVVTQGNLHKFSQNYPMKIFLLGTKKRVLVEASPVDAIWGIGLEQNDPNASIPSEWKGENLLGFALMAARDLLLDS